MMLARKLVTTTPVSTTTARGGRNHANQLKRPLQTIAFLWQEGKEPNTPEDERRRLSARCEDAHGSQVDHPAVQPRRIHAALATGGCGFFSTRSPGCSQRSSGS